MSDGLALLCVLLAIGVAMIVAGLTPGVHGVGLATFASVLLLVEGVRRITWRWS